MLPRHFGRHMLTFEYAVYAFMRKLSSAYTGGYWRYIELSNAAFDMASQHETTFNVYVGDNGFDGQISADAACLFAASHLSFQIPRECIATHFHHLRDFALDHPEGGAILATID
jgi:hypothetical protein